MNDRTSAKDPISFVLSVDYRFPSGPTPTPIHSVYIKAAKLASPKVTDRGYFVPRIQ